MSLTLSSRDPCIIIFIGSPYNVEPHCRLCNSDHANQVRLHPNELPGVDRSQGCVCMQSACPQRHRSATCMQTHATTFKPRILPASCQTPAVRMRWAEDRENFCAAH